MNLNLSPTVDQLRELFRPCDDSAGHHVVWVTKDGEVKVSRIPAGATALGFEQQHPEMQLRCDTFLAGNEYVGPEAADDVPWVAELFERLLNEWPRAKGKAEVAVIDRF